MPSQGLSIFWREQYGGSKPRLPGYLMNARININNKACIIFFFFFFYKERGSKYFTDKLIHTEGSMTREPISKPVNAQVESARAKAWIQVSIRYPTIGNTV